MVKSAENAKLKVLASLIQKYRFLYENPLSYAVPIPGAKPSIALYTIHKIEVFPQHAYPLSEQSVHNATSTVLSALDETAEPREIIEPIQQRAVVSTIQQDEELLKILAEKKVKVQEATEPKKAPDHSILQAMLKPPTTPPYRTVSHYGFNYPLTYLPTISLHPANLLSAVELQRQKIIAFINSTAMSFAAQNRPTKKPKKEEVSTLKRDDDDDEKSGSFISVKEIQLEPKRRRRRSAPKPKVVHISTSTDEHDHEHDALSEQFSSLLSVSGTYPANSQSHSGGELIHDHFDDSGDNCSSVGHHNNLGSDKLYRSYILRNFLPSSSGAEDHIEHKPEAEQAMMEQKAHNATNRNKLSNMKHEEEPKLEAPEEQHKQHITLSLNTLKRRPSGSQTDGSLHEVSASLADSGCCTASMPSNGNLRSIEIHINVSIKNSHNMDTYEQEFKTKLEKVIDDEINLISQLLEQSVHTLGAANEQGSPNQAGASATVSSSSPPKILHYSHTLALLEHELENLLNSILNANERHNRAIMCDCKTKILQITEDIRASLNVDNLGENVQNGDHSEAHLSTFSQSSKEDISTDGSPKKDKKKKKGLRTPSFLKKKKEKKKAEA